MKYYSLLTETVYTVNDQAKGIILLGFTDEVDLAQENITCSMDKFSGVEEVSTEWLELLPYVLGLTDG
jgi:hypothetical protein